jgi:hypothetical protein
MYSIVLCIIIVLRIIISIFLCSNYDGADYIHFFVSLVYFLILHTRTPNFCPIFVLLLILLLIYFQFSGITPAVATKIVTALSIGRK